MRVIYITAISLNEGDGSSTHVLEFAENFQKIGNELLIIHPIYNSNKINKYNFKSKPVFLIKKNLLTNLIFGLLSPLILLYYQLTFKADIIYCRGESRTGLIVPFCKLLNIKVALEINGIIEDELKVRNFNKHIISFARFIYKISCGLADHLIVVTKGIKKRLISDYHIDADKISVVANGANVQKFVPLNRNDCREHLKLNDNFYIGFVGSFSPWHGIDKLIYAAKFLKETGLQNIKFLMVGDGNAKIKNQLDSLIKQTAVQDYFMFSGQVTHSMVPIYINSCDICIAQYTNYSTIGDGSPLKLFEYMACGKPVIVSENVGEIAHKIKKNNCGFVFDQNNLNDLVDKIIESYRNRDMLRLQGGNSRYLVVNHFSWEKNAERIHSKLRRL